MRITNLKVRTKLSVLVGVGCIGMFLVGVIGLTGMKKAGLLIFCIGILAFVGFFITVSIIKSLKRILDVLIRIADGDLTARCEVTGSDEIGMLAKEVNITAEKLEEAISHLSRTTVLFASAADEMHATAEQMATAAEEVAAQAETVATASEEIAATSSEIAQNCTLAAKGAEDANNSAIEGAGVVQETVFGMDDIAGMVKETAGTISGLGSRSDQIGEIVGTIEDIADQTNLLALNAAIEAARAGEQEIGRAHV
jgi:methyl-accepting chemotaxis protein